MIGEKYRLVAKVRFSVLTSHGNRTYNMNSHSASACGCRRRKIERRSWGVKGVAGRVMSLGQGKQVEV